MSPAEEVKFVNAVCADALAQTAGSTERPMIFVKARAFISAANQAAPGCEVRVNRQLANPAMWRVNRQSRR